jgi:hypothetical protein
MGILLRLGAVKSRSMERLSNQNNEGFKYIVPIIRVDLWEIIRTWLFLMHGCRGEVY